MSSNQNISTISTTDHDGDGNSTAIASSILSVRLQASKLKQVFDGDQNYLLPSMKNSSAHAAPNVNTYRSLSNQMRNSSNRNDNETIHTGSKKVDPMVFSSKKTGDTSNKQHKRPIRSDGYKHETKTKENIEIRDETLGCTSSDEDDNEIDDEQDFDNSADELKIQDVGSSNNNNNRPKPGRLDLRQFDNITSAIAKLNVQPHQKAIHKVNTAKSSKTTYSSPWRSTNNNTDVLKQTETINKDAFASNTTTPLVPNSRRQLQNPRKNHGRPVAPPRLPTGLMVSSSAPSSSLINSASASCTHQTRLLDRLDNSDKLTGQEKVANSRNSSKETFGGDEVIDFSQSPIAQRLLRHSIDHKVCELNSPYESDCDLPMTPARAATRVFPRAQDLFRVTTAREAPNPSVTIGTYHRTHSAEPSELINTRGETIRQLNEILAKPPNGRPGASSKLSSTSLSGDQSQLNSQQQILSAAPSSKKSDKEHKKDKKRDEKLEKRKLKEEEKQRRQEEEKLRRQEKKLAAKKAKSSNNGEKTVDDDGIPLFIKRCIEFIEAEGLDAEGIYRVPGNRAHVDTFVQKFQDNPQLSIRESDIPVNAVATALKDFLSKKLGPIIPIDLMNELTDLSSISAKEHRASAVRDLVRRLPNTNYNILKYVFAHFVKVSLNNTLNSMDSKNLAICWWPTLLPLQFNDMVIFEQMRPHLEESIQTMIDQYDFIFE